MSDWVTYMMGGVLLIAFLLMNLGANKLQAKKQKRLAELMVTRQATIQDTDIATRIMRVVAQTATDATGVVISPEQLRLADRLDSELQLGLDSLSFFNLELGLSKEFDIRFKLPGHLKTEPTIETLVQIVEEESRKKSAKSNQ